MKNHLSEFGATENRADPSNWDPKMLELREAKFKLYLGALKAINKRYINTSLKNREHQLQEELGGKPLLDSVTKTILNRKIEVNTLCFKGFSYNTKSFSVYINGMYDLNNIHSNIIGNQTNHE